MSLLLDQAAQLDEQRRLDLKASDEAEAALIAADLAYLNGRAERDARRLAEAHALDLQHLRCIGAL